MGRRELGWLAGWIGVGLALRLLYVVLTRHYQLAGDAPEYDFEGWMISQGRWFYTRLPYGILHAGAFKAPGYPAWVGLWYTLLGRHPDGVRLVQVPIGAVTILLSWALARRLLGARAAALAAVAVAIYPLGWQYEGLLYPEALATPLTVAILIVVFTTAPGRRSAALFGVLLGISLLIRPSGEFLILAALVTWTLSVGLRRGVLLSVGATLVAVAIVAPWTVRNAIVLDGFVPISLQDAALYGTFNPQSAGDPLFPYVWRREPANDVDLFNPRRPLSDAALRSELTARGVRYIEEHPASVLHAFFWNGLSRLWDIRRRSRSLVEVPYEGRSRLVTDVGLDAYDVLLPLALLGLYRLRRRRALVVGVLALALGASLIFTVEGGTRYRAPLEPLVAVLACAGIRPGGAASGAGEAGRRSEYAPSR